MKKALIALAIVGLLIGAWMFDQMNQAPTVTPAVQQSAPQKQQQYQQPQAQPRGADDMRSLKIP